MRKNRIDIINRKIQWDSREPQELLQICTGAYRTIIEIRQLIKKTKGLNEQEFHFDHQSIKNLWMDIIERSYVKDALRELIQIMRSDKAKKGWHDKFEELLRLELLNNNTSHGNNTYGSPTTLTLFKEFIKGNERLNNDMPYLTQAVRMHNPSSVMTYKLHRLAYLMQDRFATDNKFTNLSLIYSHQKSLFSWISVTESFNNLSEIINKYSEEKVFIILGAPGSGKSTLLWHLEKLNAENAIRFEPEQNPLPFYISLSRYRPSIMDNSYPDPLEWLENQWKIRYPKMPTLLELSNHHQILLLLDGINEMPWKDYPEYVRLNEEWRELAFKLESKNIRILITCRNHDFIGLFGSQQLPVPQIQIQPLTPEQISVFLESYIPEQKQHVWFSIKDDSKLLELLSTPFFLKLFIEHIINRKTVPKGKAELITGFIRQGLKREVQRNNFPFRPGELLNENEHQAVLQSKINSLYTINGGESIMDRFSRLSFGMNGGFDSIDGFNIRIERFKALEMMDCEDDIIIRAGIALRIIDDDSYNRISHTTDDSVAFSHQLFQDYFTACQFVKMKIMEVTSLAHVNWQSESNMGREIDEEPDIDDIQILPLLPSTLWEEPTLLMAAMIGNPDEFLVQLMEHNLIVASRCTTQPDVDISHETRELIKSRLLERTKDSSADLQHRIAAGFALGDIGDPRFTISQGQFSNYIEPPMILIKKDKYLIGNNDANADDDEKPEHYVELSAFNISKFPVTNAEWQCFIAANGYDDERWWFTEESKKWRKGIYLKVEANRKLLKEREWLISVYDKLTQYTNLPEDVINTCQLIAEMDESQFKSVLDQRIKPIHNKKPKHWLNNYFNKKNQPVVGISLFEAQAYCEWLSFQTQKRYRIPTEFEWEAAAKTLYGNKYAHGDVFNPYIVNTLESQVGYTTPVGMFPEGDTPDGVSDIIGNCCEWTDSPYIKYCSKETNTHTQSLKIVRRGSSFNSTSKITTSSRYWNSPGRRNDYLGFRIVSDVD